MGRAVLFRVSLVFGLALLSPMVSRAEPPPPVVKAQGPTQPEKPAPQTQAKGAPAPAAAEGEKEPVKLPQIGRAHV